MTGLPVPNTGRDASKERPSRRSEVKQYPTLKKSLSASLSISSNSSSHSLSRAQQDGAEDVRPKTPEAKGSSQPLSLHIPKQPPAAEAALRALQNLPIPLLVLSSAKTIILANEAMGRLVGLGDHGGLTRAGDDSNGEEKPTVDCLLGQSLSQIGVDIFQGGQRIWTNWEVIGASFCEIEIGAKHSS